MKPSDWWVAIISTDHDLKDLRSSLVSHVTDLGFKVLGFEEDGFPVEPGVHSHDACLAALEKADIVILLIDKRYGGLYVHGHGQSITEGEYDKAHGQDKVVIPCVRDITQCCDTSLWWSSRLLPQYLHLHSALPYLLRTSQMSGCPIFGDAA